VASTGSGTPTVDYVLEDHEGSIASLLNSTGTIAANESFTAYGNRREASTWSGAPSATEEAIMDGITRQGFTGQTVLGQMGLNHMNGRVEDAVTGTFLSSDPRINDPYNTQDYNRYAHVYNNPLTNFDPTGFDDAPLPQVPWPGPGIDVHACGAGSTTFTIGGITGCAPEPDFAPAPAVDSAGSGVSFSGTGGQNQQQQTTPCPGTGGDPSAFRQSGPNDPTKGYAPTHDLPPGSSIVTAPNGKNFFAPPNADFVAVYQYGQSLRESGGVDFGLYFAHNYGGLFDFQRSNNVFNGNFSYASNHAIGIDAQAAGTSLAYAQSLATLRKYVGSNGAGIAQAPDAIAQGYAAAASGSCK
jgi:RHS repeat-associated protein